MFQIVYVITTLVSIFLAALQFLMIARAVLSWFPVGEDSPIVNFIYMMTEPVIFPVRVVLEQFEFVRNMPIDLSFFVAFVLLSIVEVMLP